MKVSLARLRRILIWVGLELLLATAVLGLSVWADSSARLRRAPVQRCYCGCAASKTGAGCAKMCELPKYASRRWAVTCTKPRAATPTENRDAGPRIPRPSKAERASN